MKIFYYTLIFFFAVSIAKAQSKTINATVLDETNKLLHYAIIRDIKYGTVAFSDSVGDFNINVQPDSRLTFELTGYRDTLVDADKITPTEQIILKSALDLPVETQYSSIHPIFTPKGLLDIPRSKVDLVGSRYLYDTFIHGFFNTKNGNKIYSTGYLYNYDKINGSILLCTSDRSVVKISEDQVKSLTMVNANDERLDFENVPAIDRSHFVQVLATGSRYNIYKLTKTHFTGADSETIALGQTAGHDYDEYIDDVNYYVLDVMNNQVQKFSIKKSSIRTAFARESKKVKEFMEKNSNSGNEEYIINLANYLNN